MPSRPSPEKVQTAGKVLAKIKAYDPSMSDPGEGIVLAWASALTLANIAEDIALEAVDHMYLAVDNSNFRPLPGLLIQHCREVRRERFDQERAAKEQHEEVDRTPRITMREWEELHGEKFPRAKFGKIVPQPDDVNPLIVACRHCKSSIGTPCLIPGTRMLLKLHRAHPCRFEDAAAAMVAAT